MKTSQRIVCKRADVVVGSACVGALCDFRLTIDVGEERTIDNPGCGAEVVALEVYAESLRFSDYERSREESEDWFALADRVIAGEWKERIEREAITELARIPRVGCRRG